ncbi:MBL fold metallo-hydrolase [Glaciecola sp. HTCC2999]|mgnify:FL=1|jgi:glyoxylase-like metal-dependent hydrolase (beta-lactamase superfamily II)|uniref:MBL fold metallo-hydrolase n=1 Tax=Glaciecola sp. HTCC2999 TaxID=455436 RepID=UPI0000E0EF20|nr:MBL fold metallo-hydrolase [Glaciecola sp. HTCC2999]
MQVNIFHDNSTATFTYVVVDESTKKCGIIDSVLDYDQFSATVSYANADKIITFVKENQLETEWILETHVHADHITAAHYLQEQLGGKIAMGSGIKHVLEYWVPKFEVAADTPQDGSQYDVLFDEGDTFNIGNLPVTVWHTPGHTPACASYLIENSIFVGDTIFAPHLGTARCDFPGGSAKQLFDTVKRFYTLADETIVYLGHDYPKPGDEPMAATTIGESRQHNRQIQTETELEEFVSKREARDNSLAVPKLLLPALQANMRNGQFGAPSDQGQQFIKIPVNVL